MLTAFYRHSDGHIEELAGTERVGGLLGDSEGLIWLDYLSPDEDDFAFLEKTFNFHPLAIEDSQKQSQRPKIEEYENHFFIVIQAVVGDGGDLGNPLLRARAFPDQEIDIFVGANYLVSLRREAFEPIDRLIQVSREDKGRFLRQGSDLLLYYLIDGAVDTYFPCLETIDNEIDRLEDRVLTKPDKAVMNAIFSLKKELVSLRKGVGPQREIVNALTSRDYINIKPETVIYFRDVYDHLIRIYDMLDSYRDLMSGALDVYLSTVSNQLNEIMKRLTIFAAIFMPITFITGVYGMNLAGISFYKVLLVIAVVAGANLLWFRRNKWM